MCHQSRGRWQQGPEEARHGIEALHLLPKVASVAEVVVRRSGLCKAGAGAYGMPLTTSRVNIGATGK